MRKQNQTTHEGSLKVPAYIVTFSDMTTLLLTFFVMLLSLASVQDPELFYLGRGSFIQSIRELGLGMFYGRKPCPDLGNAKIKYFISTPDKLLQGRTIHAKEEELRQILKKINRSMTTMPSTVVGQCSNFTVTDIRFSPGEATLDKNAKRFLTEFCLSLVDTRSQMADIANRESLYVLGLARRSGIAEKQQQGSRQARSQWILSARRAQAVADFLHSKLNGNWLDNPPSPITNRQSPPWRIYWWGAGPGGDWVGKDSPISKQSQILIAVLRTDDET